MITITFEDEHFKQWTCDYIFHTSEDAKAYLIERGFSGDGKIMERSQVGWEGKTKAYIMPKKIYTR